jgi:hypothetical protein
MLCAFVTRCTHSVTLFSVILAFALALPVPVHAQQTQLFTDNCYYTYFPTNGQWYREGCMRFGALPEGAMSANNQATYFWNDRTQSWSIFVGPDGYHATAWWQPLDEFNAGVASQRSVVQAPQQPRQSENPAPGVSDADINKMSPEHFSAYMNILETINKGKEVWVQPNCTNSYNGC